MNKAFSIQRGALGMQIGDGYFIQYDMVDEEMLTETTFKLPDVLLSRAQKYAEEKGTTLTALIRELLDDVANVDHDPLLEFSQGKLTKEQAIEILGLRDYAQLLVVLGEADLPLPALPPMQIEQQVEMFSELWNSL